MDNLQSVTTAAPQSGPATVAFSPPADGPGDRRADARRPITSRRDQRFRVARARLHERVTRWLELNDPDAYFNHVSHAQRMARIVEWMTDVHGRVLDVGPFTGVLAERIIAQGDKEVYGIDSHESALRQAARRGVLPVLADVEEEGISCEDETFDGAVMGDVLGYIIDPDDVLSEVHRVLKPGARFVLSVPNMVSLGNRLLALLGHGPYDMDVRPFGGGYQRYYTMGSLRTLLVDNGFEVLRMETNLVHLPLHRLPITWRLCRAEPGSNRHRFWYWHWLARVVPGLGEDVVVLARKG